MFAVYQFLARGKGYNEDDCIGLVRSGLTETMADELCVQMNREVGIDATDWFTVDKGDVFYMYKVTG